MKRIGITLSIVGGAVGIVVGLLSFVAAFFLGEGSILIASFASGAGGILGIAGGFLAKSRRRAGAVVVALGGALGVWLVWGRCSAARRSVDRVREEARSVTTLTRQLSTSTSDW
jgi:hypothetical protein